MENREHLSPVRRRFHLEAMKQRGNSERIVINVSGRKFEVRPHVLAKHPGTLLGGKEREQFFDSERKEYFFDRDPDLFTYVIKYYLSNKVHYPEDECVNLYESELRYFGIPIVEMDCCFESFGEPADEYKEKVKHEEKALREERERQEQINKPNKTLREKTWLLFEEPHSVRCGIFMHYISGIFIIVSILGTVVETMPCGSMKCSVRYPDLFFVTECVCVVAFTIEYFTRLLAAPQRWVFVKRFMSIVDFVAILPFYVGLTGLSGSGGPFTVLRVLRVMRIFKISRHSNRTQKMGRGLKESLSDLGFFFVTLVALVLIYSTLMYFAEREQPGTNFTSIPECFWYTLVTMTTLGYGDMAPVTEIGQLCGAFCSLSGILVVALPIPVLTKKMT